MTDNEHIPYDWARVKCPICGALPDQRCRQLTDRRTTDAHVARYIAGGELASRA
jgi:hypothetical protein